MPAYFFPCLFLIPRFDEAVIDAEGARLHKRLWETSTFDLATLASKHVINFDWQIMGAFLRSVNLEIEITDAENPSKAQERARLLQAMLYLDAVGPFIIPYFSTHSINDYSGINSRDSQLLKPKLPVGLRDGPTSEAIKVEAWIHEPSLTCAQIGLSHDVDATAFQSAVRAAKLWSALEIKFPALRIVHRVLTTAPLIPDASSRLLHMWTGIEALFPQVQTEVSFRLALLIAQLTGGLKVSHETYRAAKKLYVARSHAAHGNLAKVKESDVRETWLLLTLCMSGVISRNRLPSEDELLSELLGDAEGRDPAD